MAKNHDNLHIGGEKENQPEEEIISENIPEAAAETEKASFKKRIGSFFKAQERNLAVQEKKNKPGVLSKIKTWAAVTLVAGTSFLAIGCKGGGHPSGGPNEQQNSGFTDNEQDVVQQRVKMGHDNFKHMKKMQGYQANEEAKQSAKDMQEGHIVQPTNNESDSGESR